MPDSVKTSRLVLILAIVGGCTAAESDSTVAGAVFEWHEANTELYAPVFSPDGAQVAFVRRRHHPDGHEAEMRAEAGEQPRSEHAESDERYEDPQIVVVGRDSDVEVIDWGWDPSFSSDGKRIAYAAQIRPLTGLRVLASTLSGNEIRIYDRDVGSSQTIAIPESGYLSAPIFSPDDSTVVFSFSDAINGAYGGNVGIGQVQLSAETMEALYPPTKGFDLYHLVGPKRFVAQDLLAVRCKPQEEGTFLADEYACALIQVGGDQSVVYDWETVGVSDLRSNAFATGPSNDVFVYSDGWRSLESDGSTELAESIGIPSPNTRLLATTSGQSVEILDFVSGVSVKRWELAGPIRDMAWSGESDHIAVIVSRYQDDEQILFDYDQLVVLEITR